MGTKGRCGSPDRGGRGSERPEQGGKDSAHRSDGRRVFGSGEGLERTRSQVIEPVLTPAARRHIGQLRRAIRPDVDRLDRRFAAQLRGRGYDAAVRKAFLGITPAAAARAGRMSSFLEQVRYSGRRLAKLNIPPGEVTAALTGFGTLL